MRPAVAAARAERPWASRVYVGSHDLSHNANDVHDEVLVELAAESPAQRPVHDAFVAHVATAYASATPL